MKPFFSLSAADAAKELRPKNVLKNTDTTVWREGKRNP